MSASFKPVSQVLFDMDGLLLNTEIIYTRVTQQIVGRFGKTFDWSIKANMIGRGIRLPLTELDPSCHDRVRAAMTQAGLL